MLNKKLPPAIGKFAGAWSSGNWAGLLDPTKSPKSPLDFDTQSPSPSLKHYHLGGVGLGIVVEMEKLGEIVPASKATFGQNLIHPNPNPVREENEAGDLEDYTFVTCHGPNKSYTRVYCDESRRGLVWRRNHRVVNFYISSSKFEEFAQYPPHDFLNTCHLCKKQLHGKDIYMYRGEKGFCSNECRCKQIMMDRRDEKCLASPDI